jgi:hypothetical protein
MCVRPQAGNLTDFQLREFTRIDSSEKPIEFSRAAPKSAVFSVAGPFDLGRGNDSVRKSRQDR